MAKPIYLSQNLKGLKALAEKTENASPNVKSLSTLLQGAQDALKNGDEERAYVLFFRYSEMYMKVRNKQADQKHFDLMYMSDFKRSIEATEKLTKSLESRYNGLATPDGQPPLVNGVDGNKRYTNGSSNNGLTNGAVHDSNGAKSNVSGDDVQSNGDMVTNNLIKCEELFDFLESDIKKKADCPPAPQVLILDCRPANDFEKSKMELTSMLKERKDRVVVVNIADDILQGEGLAFSALSRKLTPDVVNSLKCRKTVKKVVLLDWRSGELKKNNTSLTSLFNALWKVSCNSCCPCRLK